MRQKTFDELLKMFSENFLSSCFDITLPTYIYKDAHKTGICASKLWHTKEKILKT